MAVKQIFIFSGSCIHAQIVSLETAQLVLSEFNSSAVAERPRDASCH